MLVFNCWLGLFLKRLTLLAIDLFVSSGCQKCGATVPYAFEKGRFSLPTKCSNPNCRSRSFTLIRPTARYTNVQELRLQESQEESTSHAGRTPRQFEVELNHHLIDTCRPGDIILLACTVDAVNSALAAGRAGKRAQETSTYKLFLQGHSITTLSESNNQVGGGGGKFGSEQSTSGQGGPQVAYTQQQLQQITQLCHADHRCLSMVERRAFPFDLLVRSLCPSIIGHHAVKAGILLCLLGGTPPVSEQMDRGNTIRSNSHILIVGDPGMGKSQMLLAATQLASRSVYVGGNTASTTGLTVTLTKEEGGETGIEAGALVLADQGVACIDELDKCKHLDGLLEAMEQQCVSIAKAGVVASLPARCSIVAAANPKHGSYNMSKSVAENLNMARPILSRFDLVFILRDRVDKDQDRLVSSNIMNLYRKPNATGKIGARDEFERLSNELSLKSNTAQHGENSPTDQNYFLNTEPNRVPLEKRLTWVAGFNEALPAGLVRDYIAYAREYCKPKLTSEAAVVLREYYMTLRYPANGRHHRDSVPITTRQLEALIRLSQARAKACLREFVLREDALDVVELLKRSVEQVHTDEFGMVDRSRAGARGQSNRKLRREFTRELHTIIGVGAECTYDDLLRVSNRVNCPLSDFNTIIDDMRNNGTLIKKSNRKYQIVS
uniref:DNA helicase n=1 Tax=Pseudo-nitzschia australis TaxID=44445 RepID=A0A7S4AML8_9STRA